MIKIQLLKNKRLHIKIRFFLTTSPFSNSDKDAEF